MTNISLLSKSLKQKYSYRSFLHHVFTKQTKDQTDDRDFISAEFIFADER